ncbi:VIT1/CCC1 transporter family protein [Dokdonella immobilis]|uniref:Predicted Fe2+/Mn2+ transporter, VIT1/CCC1 family n=1 Tax=Dokdonella immobilis TaxID=578942 RepID=A0A1I4ZYM4_9GAMM|nr:VIT family protein [Dokdonella immobilis]SFN55324.1 Predicted Fe2+/Mn2+ transporter, VIT1/CCC1 family [Dokdonella immobilis]
MLKHHTESHRTDRMGWLRAAVLGANDGIVSTASLIVGVAAAHAGLPSILLAGVAGLVGGAFSMAAGEYISVSSQADIERADLDVERRELETSPQHELRELAAIYVKRGLDPALAGEVAAQLTRHDALGAHARDELGITHETRARPLLAAGSSAAAFAVGAALPLVSVMLIPEGHRVVGVMLAALLSLALLGAAAARAGGAPVLIGAARVVIWSALAMLATAWVGSWFGTPVA